VTWESTQTSACDLTFSRLSLAAFQSCVTVSDSQFHLVTLALSKLDYGDATFVVLPSDRVADMPSQSRLRTTTSSQLTVRPLPLVTAGEQSFDSAGPKLWNGLPLRLFHQVIV